MPVNIKISSLGDKFKDYRDDIPGDSYNWGPAIDAGKIRYFAFHHSVTPQTAKKDGNWKAECDKIANLHIAQGWGGVGYRFIICSDGTVAYVGDLSHGGSAVAGNNHIIFSACFIGDFTKELPTAAQVHSAHLLQKFFRDDLPQYPLLDSSEDIIGHQDAATLLHLPGAEPTACPGSNWRVAGDNLRDRILNDRWSGYPDPKPAIAPAPTPPPVPAPQPAPFEERLASLEKRMAAIEAEFGTLDNLVTTASPVVDASKPNEQVPSTPVDAKSPPEQANQHAISGLFEVLKGYFKGI